MITSSSKGVELRFPTANGGEGIAAHILLRTDSALNFLLELHVPDPVLLAAHKTEAVEAIDQFLSETRSAIRDSLDLDEIK